MVIIDLLAWFDCTEVPEQCRRQIKLSTTTTEQDEISGLPFHGSEMHEEYFETVLWLSELL